MSDRAYTAVNVDILTYQKIRQLATLRSTRTAAGTMKDVVECAIQDVWLKAVRVHPEWIDFLEPTDGHTENRPGE